jgi:hypothetical protein
MKKYITLFTFFLFAKMAAAQYSLTFCEDVTKDGKPMMVSNQFMVDAEGGVLKFLVRSDEKFNTDQLDFRIYYMSDSGVEEEISRMAQPVQADWGFAWKELVMFDPGMYRIKIYNAKGTYLTSANVTIKSRL